MKFKTHVLHRRRDGEVIHSYSEPFDVQDLDICITRAANRMKERFYVEGKPFKVCNEEYIDILIIGPNEELVEVLRYNASELR